MFSAYHPAQRSDGRLWAAAFGLSLVLNALILLLAGFAMSHGSKWTPAEVAVPEPMEPLRLIAPEWVESEPLSEVVDPVAVPEEVAQDPSFARTSPDQAAERPEVPRFIGERNTRATSDATPDPNAPAMPAQAGIEPRPGEIETTESRYQDGALSDPAEALAEPLTQPAPPVPVVPPVAAAEPAVAPKGVEVEEPGKGEAVAEPAAAERLATSPYPVDVPVPRETVDGSSRPREAERPREGREDGSGTADAVKQAEVPPPSPDSPKQPAFRGYQRKTTLHGSITRSGRSALDVEDNALGRYQAVISRAVELEWQRNCVRYRDFITPGFLTARFYVDGQGKVTSVDFVGEMKTGQQQKGFTLNSIRNASIPAMPAELKKELRDEPLELIFNFYF